jgi:DsbC/DsbD-like thiol-disulfide interchange protein
MRLLLTFVLAIASCSAVPIEEPHPTALNGSGTNPLIENPATARLVADVQSIGPGDTFRVGVSIDMKPGWHIYWKNPGEAGLPTSVRFHAPDGLDVGNVVWPTPKRFSQPGDILGYGYEGDALFVSQVRTSRDLKPGTEIIISADVGWLCCEKVCIPGKANLSLRLLISDKPEPGDVALFDSWQRKSPLDIVQSSSLAAVQISGELGSNTAPEAFEIVVLWKRRQISDVEWFPAPGDTIDITNIAVRTEADRTRIGFSAQVLGGVGTAPNSFESLVAFTDTHGTRQALRVPVPLRRT